MNIWVISDTHGRHDQLIVPGNIDMVIHCGDAGNHRIAALNEYEILHFLEWYNKLPIEYKIYVPGNHDGAVECGLIKPTYPGIYILINAGIEINGINIWGSPYSLEFNSWAYQLKRKHAREHWHQIPINTDILITHGPPHQILDSGFYGEVYGDQDLRERIEIVAPKYHLFGHIHECAGQWVAGLNTKFVNACIVDFEYEKINNGFVIDDFNPYTGGMLRFLG